METTLRFENRGDFERAKYYLERRNDYLPCDVREDANAITFDGYSEEEITEELNAYGVDGFYVE